MSFTNTDAPFRHGHFAESQHPGYSYDMDGQLIPTCSPDIAAQIDAANHWQECGEATERSHTERFEDAAELLTPLLMWLGSGREISSIGRRAVLLITILRPGIFDGESITEVAKRFGTSKQSIAKYSAELHLLCRGIFSRSRTMQHAGNRRIGRKRAVEMHKRLGHKLGKRVGDSDFRTHAARVVRKIHRSIESR